MGEQRHFAEGAEEDIWPEGEDCGMSIIITHMTITERTVKATATTIDRTTSACISLCVRGGHVCKYIRTTDKNVWSNDFRKFSNVYELGRGEGT